MKSLSIKKYLRASAIMGRKSTFSNAFASALAPHDVYSPVAVQVACAILGRIPMEPCIASTAARGATWDYVFNREAKGDFSRHGHRVRNLVPCCSTCNESKGQKPWRDYLDALNPSDRDMPGEVQRR